jgi:polar amino acid transport system substrate-binding protein
MMKRKINVIAILLLALCLAVSVSACSGNDGAQESGDSAAQESGDDVAQESGDATTDENAGESAGESAGGDNSLQAILDKGELVLGCDDAFPPMGFIGDDDEIVGFDIDLARAAAEKIGVKLVAKPIVWDAKELELQSGNIDVIWNGYSIMAERIDKVTFTKPYLNNSQMLMVRADSDIASKADLAGKIVGAQIESAAEALVLKDTAFNDSLEELRTYDDYQDALNDLKSSTRIDAVAVDKILIDYIMQQSPDTFKTLDEPLGDEYFGIGCRLGEVALADAIDKALDELQADGVTKSVSEKWFSGGDIVVRDVPRLTAADF